MTMISRLGYFPNKEINISPNKINSTKNITIVIPVKNNQKGIDNFLTAFFKTHTEDNFPREIIIVDNNSKNPLLISDTYPIPVRIISCTKEGPGSARNMGVSEVKTEWILFTDSDCIPTSKMLEGYLECTDEAIGFAGNVKSYKKDFLSRYYETQEILIPPHIHLDKQDFPNYLVTANCLVYKQAFEKVKGFNEEIKIAGGEDIDLGFKLLSVGKLVFAHNSIVFHNFEFSIFDFKKRFLRYGKGNKIISRLYNIDLSPKPFKPNKKNLINYILAYLQYFFLKKGYNN